MTRLTDEEIDELKRFCIEGNDADYIGMNNARVYLGQLLAEREEMRREIDAAHSVLKALRELRADKHKDDLTQVCRGGYWDVLEMLDRYDDAMRAIALEGKAGTP